MSMVDFDTSRLAIDIHTQNARLEISNNLSRRMRIRVVRPQMVVERKSPTFKLERARRSQLSLSNSAQFRKFVAHRNLQSTHLAGTGSSKNNILLDDNISYRVQTDQPVYSVELQDVQNANSMQQSQLQTVGSQEIIWDPGYMKVDWVAGGIQIEWDENTRPDIQVSPYAVEINVRGRNVVRIAVKDNMAPGQKGRKINKHV